MEFLKKTLLYSFSGGHENWESSYAEESCAVKKSQTGLESKPHPSLFQIKFTFFSLPFLIYVINFQRDQARGIIILNLTLRRPMM